MLLHGSVAPEIAGRFPEHLRELAWRDRDVAPELSTVVLDEIRRFSADPDGWDPRSLE